MSEEEDLANTFKSHGDDDDVLHLEYEWENMQYPRLNDLIRQQYFKYLERQLNENYCTWKQHQDAHEPSHNDQKLDQGSHLSFIRRTAELLEDKALQACMIAQFYQRAMIQIIGNVRSCTQDQQLVKQLANLINNQKRVENEIVESKAENQTCSEETTQNSIKMEITQELTGQAESMTVQMIKDENIIRADNNENGEVVDLVNGHGTAVSNIDLERSNDSVDMELARMFSEDCGELDEIFGLKEGCEMQDPLVCRILEEIEQSEVGKRTNQIRVGQQVPLIKPHGPVRGSSNSRNANKNHPYLAAARPPDQRQTKQVMARNTPTNTENRYPPIVTDLSKSLWPCELYRQKRKLSNILSCLVDEDYRWLEIVKWKFKNLFGEDSDDEFAHCSPTIELDEVLIGSCIRRITPWIVKHLMPPLREGLIGNRFLFKKLAKQLSRTIILANQYPDESFIKYAIENFFCIRNRVNSMDDLIEMPNILF